MQHTSLAALIAGLFVLPVQAQEIFTLDEIIVTATRIPTRVRENLMDVSVVERTAIERLSHASLPELLGTLPGIQITDNGGRGSTSTLSLRGGNTGHTAVLIDGMRISSATLGTTAIHAIPLEQIGRIEVVRGPIGGLYGTDAMSGVIQVFTPQGSGKPGPTAYLGAGSHGTSIVAAGYGGQIGGTRFNLRAGLEHSDGFSTIKAAKGGLFDMYNPDNDPYSNRNASANVSHRISRDLEVGVGGFYAQASKHYDATNCDAFAAVCTANYDNKNLQRLELLQAHIDYRINDLWDIALRVGQSLDYSKNWLLDPSTSIVTIDHYQTRQNQASWQNNIKAWGGLLTLTAENRNLDVGSSKQFVVSEQDTQSLSLGYQIGRGNHVLQASGRRDHISRLGSHNSSFLGYGYRLGGGWTAKASYGTAFHAPSFNDLYWPLDTVNFFQGNPNLNPERARNREIGLDYSVSDYRAALTLYHNKISNLLDYVAGVAPTWIGTYGNVNSATIKGATLDYGAKLGSWSLKGSIDFLNAQDDATGRTLQRRAPRTASIELHRDFGRLDLGCRMQATSGRFNDRANTQKLSGYATLDIDANYRIGPSWSLETRVGNLFDKDYTLVRSTMSPYNDYAVPGRTLFVGLRYVPK